MATSRGQWNSRFGFILAAAGSAIGLGNIWRFPYTAGENGGGAFVLLYIVFVFAIGVPVLLAELAVGRATQKSTVTAFKELVPNSWWPAVGGLGVLTGFGILSFYAVIAGLTLGYVYFAATGRLSGQITPEESAAIFSQLTTNPVATVSLTAVFLLLTAVIVQKGVGGGIERAAKVLMPVFFVFLLFLVGRALTLDGAGEGLAFLFYPDFSQLSTAGVMSALGQALFSLSIGMGCMITYGSYLSEKENIPISAISVALFDTSIALLGGLIIFPTLFAVGASPGQGPGLVFVVMASIFDALPAGNLFAVVFYALLAIAALTSTISLLEVTVAYFIDDRGWARGKAVWTVTLVCLALAIPSALALGAHAGLSNLLGEGRGFLDLMSIVWGDLSLPVGAAFLCLFVGWRWGTHNALASIEAGGRLPMSGLWSIMVRFVSPAAVIAVLVFTIVQL